MAAGALAFPLAASPVLGSWTLPAFGRVSAVQEALLGLLAGIAGLWAAWIALAPGKRRPLDPLARQGAGGLLGWVALGIASAALASDEPGMSFRAALIAGAPAVLALAWLSALRGGVPKGSWRIVWAGGALAALDALALKLFGGGLVAWTAGPAGGWSERGGVATLAGHPNYLGSSLAILFFLKCRALASGRDSKALLGALALLDLAALFAVGARGASLGVLAGLGAWGALSFLSRRFGVARAAALLGAGTLAGALAFAGLAFQALPRGEARALGSGSLAARLLSRGPVTTRLHAYLGAAGLFRDSPVLGAGPGRFDAALWDEISRQLADRDDSSSGRLASPFFLEAIQGASHGHAHNELLHAMAERGLPGAFALLLAWGSAAGLALGRRDFALFGGLAAAAADAQFGFPLHAPWSAYLLAPLLALAWVPDDVSAPGEPREPSKAARWLGALGFGLLSAGVLWASGSAAASILASRSASARLQAKEIEALAGAELQARAIRLDPANAAARRARVRDLLRANLPGEAVREARELAALTGDPLDWSWLGKARLAVRDEAGAAESFRRSALLNPRREAGAVYWAWASFARWRELRSPDRARDLREALERLRLLNFRHPLIALAEGSLALASGAPPRRALALFRAGLEASPNERAAPASQEEFELAALEAQARALLQRESARLEEAPAGNN